MLANSHSNMAIKSRKGQRRTREDVVAGDGTRGGGGGVASSSSNQQRATTTKEPNERLARRISALKEGSKRSVLSSESSGSKLSGTATLDTEFDLDKHRDYDIKDYSRQNYLQNDEEYESSLTRTASDDNDNLTEEQRAWAGIDAILDDNQSVEQENVLSEEIMAALHHSPSGRGEENYNHDDEEEDSEDSHDQAMKMLCGLKEDGESLPGLMNSSFSSQFSQESARSVLSYLSRNNIIVQRDIQNGPLKSFLTEMAFNLERECVEEEEGEELEEEVSQEDIDFDDDETDIHLIESDVENDEDEQEMPVGAPDSKQFEQRDEKEDVKLDPIGQQIINAIMMEMKRMKESDEWDEDDPNPVEEEHDEEQYYSEEEEESQEEYYEEDLVEEYEQKMEPGVNEIPPRSPKSHSKNTFKPASKTEPIIDPRDLSEIKDSSFVPDDDDLNNSVPSLDTFQEDEVCKILGHQNPMAWASFGDLHFDSNNVSHARGLPTTPFDDGKMEEQNPPMSPLRSVKNEIVSGVVGAPLVRDERQSPPSQPTQTKPKRPPNPKSPLKKKKKPVATSGTEGGIRRSVSRRDGGSPAEMRRSTTARPKNPAATAKVLRKSVKRSDGTPTTPKVIRKSVRRSDGTTATPKLIRKSISRPDGAAAASPNTMRKSVSRQSTSRQSPTRTPSLVKKPVVRHTTKRNPSMKEGAPKQTGEGESEVRRSVRKARPANPDLGSSQSRMNPSVEDEVSHGVSQSPTRKKIIKGMSIQPKQGSYPTYFLQMNTGRAVAPSEEKKRRSVRKVRPASSQ